MRVLEYFVLEVFFCGIYLFCYKASFSLCLLRIKLKKDRGRVLFVAILWRNGTVTIIDQNVGMI